MILFLFTVDNQSINDPTFLSNLYLDHYRLMYRMAMRKLGNHHDAEDVLNSTALEMRKHTDLLKSLSFEDQQKYLCRSVINSCSRKVADRNRLTNLVNLDDESVSYVQSTVSAETEYLQLVGTEELLSALRRLPKREFDIFVMKYLNDWTDDEISETLSVTQSSVRVYLARMREHARIILKGGDKNGGYSAEEG